MRERFFLVKPKMSFFVSQQTKKQKSNNYFSIQCKILKMVWKIHRKEKPDKAFQKKEPANQFKFKGTPVISKKTQKL